MRFVALLLALVTLIPLASPQEKRLSIYSTQLSYQMPISDTPDGEYVGLLEALEPLGKVESKVDGSKWKLRFTPNGIGSSIDAEFRNGKTKGKVRGTDVELPAKFVLQGDRGLVPISSLPNLLPRFVEQTVQYHAAGHRLFLGASAVKFTQELKKNPTRLVVTFPAAVNPNIQPEGNKLRVTFQREPVVSGADNVAYGDPAIASSSFSEANGVAELTVVGNAPLQGSLSDGNKVLTVSPVVQAAAPAPQTPTAQTPAGPTTPPAPQTVRKPSGPRAYFVVIDAGHGGDERGAQLTETLNEKDITLALARRIQHELETRGVPTTMVRSADATMTADQRAQAANASRASVYISIHVATLGTGVRVFTALMPSNTKTARRAFLPWETAQASFLDMSSTVAGSIAAELDAKKIPVRALSAPVRPLNNIAEAAVAIEVAPPEDRVESLTDAKYQQNIANAIAGGIAAIRAKLEAAQ